MDPVTIKFSKVYDTLPAKAAWRSGTVEEAVEALTELVKCVGEYASPGDLSRAIMVVITPWAVATGLLTAQECPPCRIIPEEAKIGFGAILDTIHGEAAKQGCRLL